MIFQGLLTNVFGAVADSRERRANESNLQISEIRKFDDPIDSRACSVSYIVREDMLTAQIHD
jgi:hypothetical protein